MPLYTKVQRSVDKMIRIVREDVQGIRVIKALSKNDYEHRRYDAANKVLVGDEKRAGTVMSIVNPVMTLLMNVGIVAVVALSASRVANHLSDPETVIAFMQYFTLISMAMMSVTRIFVMQTKCAASAKRIGEVLAVGEDMALQSEEAFPNAETDAHIVFDRVSFSYKGAGNDLTDISFAVPRGGSLGIIGATGSGKSTVVRLLQRFYDVGAGSVRINGRNVRTIPRETLSAMFGAAMQNDFLYSDTIEENIRFGRALTHEQIVEAAKTARPTTSSPRSPRATATCSRRRAPTFPAARSSASSSRAPWRRGRKSSCWTTARPRSITRPTPACAARLRKRCRGRPSSPSRSASARLRTAT